MAAKTVKLLETEILQALDSIPWELVEEHIKELTSIKRVWPEDVKETSQIISHFFGHIQARLESYKTLLGNQPTR